MERLWGVAGGQLWNVLVIAKWLWGTSAHDVRIGPGHCAFRRCVEKFPLHRCKDISIRRAH